MPSDDQEKQLKAMASDIKLSAICTISSQSMTVF